ncbi:MAG: ABC transporter ATP-binding protein [Deltaproteobacteria bacterium]|nr:ABC transporter ATP-binding protein [Deltaproteobacteria bacterium]
MVSVALRGLTKRFGPVVAVDGANLTVNHGEFLVVVGESGCGKTTTLRLITGLETPDSGYPCRSRSGNGRRRGYANSCVP